nr:fasciclin domain-containing protein [uncultured Arsenicibacter sp.]
MKRIILSGLLSGGLLLASQSLYAQIIPESQLSQETTAAPADKKQSWQEKKAVRRRERDERRMQRRTDTNSRMQSDRTTAGYAPVNPPSAPAGQHVNKSMEAGAVQNQDASYRQESVNSGNMMNNSNVSNYNSQQVTAPPTGVNATPVTTPAMTAESAATKSAESPDLTKRAATGTGQAINKAVTTAPTVPIDVASPRATVGDFTSSQPDYTTLQNALQAVNLDQTLKGAGPYTLFAPSNAAFKKLPVQTQNTMLEGENRDVLTRTLRYHVVAGTLDAKELMRQIKAGQGKAQLKTLDGRILTAQLSGNNKIILLDESGKTAMIDTPDERQANGIVHGITAVLSPVKGK